MRRAALPGLTAGCGARNGIPCSGKAMRSDFNDFKNLLRSLRPDAADLPNGAVSIALGSSSLMFFPAPDDADCLFVRTRVVSLSEVTRAGEFARAALAGNFFWHATRGARLSIGPDRAVYLTERRLIDGLADPRALAEVIENFQLTVTDWQIRSSLYA